MNRPSKSRFLNSVFALLLALSVGLLAGCQEQGPAEEAGENIDEATEEAADAVEEAVDDAEEEIDDSSGSY